MLSNSSNKRLTIKLLLATALMFGFGFALVPLYDIMCDALGINGKTSDVLRNSTDGYAGGYYQNDSCGIYGAR